MQFSVGVEYVLHCLLYLVNIEDNRAIGIKDLAAYQGISESYLSKFFAKLKKQGILESVPGVNGGYRLGRPSNEISFWEVIEAIEGNEPLFRCSEIRRNEKILDKDNLPESHTHGPCLIHKVMLEGEEQMKSYLRGKTLQWLSNQVSIKLPKEQMDATSNWFKRNI